MTKNISTLEVVGTHCPPLGTDIDRDVQNMLLEPDLRQEFAADFDQAANDVEQANVWRTEDLENGTAAQRAMEIGCSACALADVCVIKEALETRFTEGKEHESFMNVATMLASAPAWLSAARINRSGVDGVQMLKKLGSADEAERLYAAGELPLRSLVGKTTNHISDEISKKDHPLLRTLDKVDPEARLSIYEIETPVGTYDVIDASKAVGFNGEPLGPHEYGNLTSKLLNRMEEADNTGKAQIFTADNKMQKVISKRGDATLFEMRMSGKNRLYFWASQPKNGNAQITIIGSHGGDEATQHRFIDNYTS
jgi:hypothetical protein